jgi:multimeric flavodoxin WrbA
LVISWLRATWGGGSFLNLTIYFTTSYNSTAQFFLISIMKALIINCTLKKSPSISNTQALINKAVKILQKENVETEVVRLVDYDIKPGTSTDEGNGDEWLLILEKIKQCNIFIIGTPVWVGRLASTAQRVIERLDAIFMKKDLLTKKTGNTSLIIK